MKKKVIALVLAAVMALSLAACGSKAPSESTDGTKYVVGICQIAQHEALDAATKGFEDALNEALPGQVEFLE